MAHRSEAEANGDDHPQSSSQAEKPLPHFFKIILPRTITQKKLKIPTKFVRKFGDELSDVANFILPNGYHCKVGLTRVQNEIWFDNGWHEFAEHHSICKEYLLVFRYRGFSNFSVLIFDVSSCEIEYPHNDQILTCGDNNRIQNQVDVDCNTLTEDLCAGTVFKSKACDASASKIQSGKRLPLSELDPRKKKISRGVGSSMSPNFERQYQTRNKVKAEQLAELINGGANKSRRNRTAKRKISRSCEVIELQDGNCSEGNSNEDLCARTLLPRSTVFKSKVCDASTNKMESSKRLPLSELNPRTKKRSRGVSSSMSPNFKHHYQTRNKKAKIEQLVELTDGYANKSRRDRTNKQKISCAQEVIELQDGNWSEGDNKWVANSEEYIETISSEMSKFIEVLPESKTAMLAAGEYKPKQTSFMIVLRPYNCYAGIISVPRQFSGNFHRKGSKYIKVEVSDGREWTIGLRRIRGLLQMGKGLSAFFRDNNLKTGDVCVFELIIKNSMALKASIFHTDISIITNAAFEFTEVSPETKRAIGTAREYKPKYPSFMVVLRSLKLLNVPKDFSSRYLYGTLKNMKLEVSDKRKWEISLRKNRSLIIFGNGMKAFSSDNNLKEGDVCVFELTRNNGVMKVSIFPAVEDAETSLHLKIQSLRIDC
ncbi:uncharacterized protein LOC126683254 [Mercurialis annua]|uniref:uncharacterized protein LOC126683254 n=1 Tax=Mercurialis annua TaxID=3986 RepID=UPI00215E4AB6|nr:uncharacterized protein LOC126683254 [Mercurialis annua]